MTRAELRLLKESYARLVILRRQLGSFDANAEAILLTAETVLRILEHLEGPAKKKKK